MMNSSTSLGVPPFPIKEGKRMSAEWAELPQEIVEYISKRLTIYIDYLRFRCVCRPWNYYVPKIPLHLPPQLPWLMLSHNSFFDLSTNKLHRLNLPSFSHETRIIGSSHGWLVIIDGYGWVHLLNPIICATVSLPSLRNFPESVRMLFLDHNIYLIKVVLSASPLLNKDFAALAILSRRNLAFCRKGYDSWVLFNANENHHWIDAVYKNGLFYVVSVIGTVAVCDVEGPSISIIETTISTGSLHRICYVMFSGEDMLMVTRDFTLEFEPLEFGPEPDVWTVGFVIYKLNWNLLKWEEIQTLGEHSLFIGKNYSLSFSAADFVGCRSNCVYFTDDLAGKRDFGIYSLSDERIEQLPCNPQNSYCCFGCPIWVTPNPQ
ncbi:probable F-box protein At1g44080 [Vicia villosa]|uniref:probable F-box protein At1g44080 n=1 Tax=Vicia villosa TaxID=3911 RepID=UPI00273AC659|nr:probable F-box protein At1g44080 [Vicia villosa]XP_058785514.1 probable F-box protein At1g44080 [Vicia villosa]XP_058785515.1 probable F-box protein At1g44080 [Vicia villosa]